MPVHLPRKLKINSSRYYLENFARAAAESLPIGAIMLDAGAGDCIYKPLFSHVTYEAADICKLDKAYGEINYVCDLSEIPVEDNRYDLVFCSQTLEHLPDPQKVLKELFRVLKPGGKLWLSAPLFYEEHEIPYDYFRYTQYGLRRLCEETGFAINTMQWLEGYYGTLSYQLNMAARVLSSNPTNHGSGLIGFLSACSILLLKPFFAILSIYFAHLDLKYKFTSAGQCKNYTLTATKITEA